MLHRYTYILGILKLIIYKLIFLNKLKLNGLPKISHKASFRTRKKCKIILNKNSYFAEGTLLRVTDNAEFIIGKSSGFNSYCVITCRKKIIIGNNVMFGPFVTIHDHNHIYKTKKCMKNSGYECASIKIEDNVWIGGNVIILKGVTIGEGSVIGAGAIITKDVPPHTIIYSKQNIVMNKIEIIEEDINE